MISSTRANTAIFQFYGILKSRNNFISGLKLCRTIGILPITSSKLNLPINISKRTLFSTRVCAIDSRAKVNPNQTIDSSTYLAPHVDERFSYAYGRSIKELKYYTFAPLIKNMCSLEPHSTAVVFYDEGISKSFEQLNQDINKLVNGMVHKLKLRKQDVVGIYSYNTYQYVVTQLACNKLGIIVNHFNPSYKAHELTNVLAKSDVKVLFMPGKNSRQSELNNHWAIISSEEILQLQNDGKLKDFRQIILFDGDSDKKEFKLKDVKIDRWRSIYSNDSTLSTEAELAIEEVLTDDIYGIYYTSGTTGVPKGATITQFTAINNVALACDRLYKNRGPNWQSIRGNACVPLPLFHQFSGVPGLLCPFINGGSFVCPGMKYDINAIYESIMRFKCNMLFCTPTILIDFLDYLKKNNIDTEILPIKSLLLAGTVISPELVHKTHKEMKSLEEIKIGYGASENGVLVTLQTSHEDFESRAHTCGTPLDFSEMRVINVNTGKITQLGEPGELQTRGYNTMVGYYNEPAKTDEVLTKSRWYKTGDLATIDATGHLRIVGRLKDLIIKGGENIYPAEVEVVIHSHKAVKDAHVFGVPDKRYVEEVCAWIQLDRKPENVEELKNEIKEFCRQKLSYNKVPKYIIFADSFPLTPTKKIMKYAMRDETIKMLNLEHK